MNGQYVLFLFLGLPIIKSFAISKDDLLVTLECTVEGNPEPSVTFSYKGQPVTSVLQGHTVKGSRMLIEVEFLKTEYRCVAGNIHGTSYRTVSGKKIIRFIFLLGFKMH